MSQQTRPALFRSGFTKVPWVITPVNWAHPSGNWGNRRVTRQLLVVSDRIMHPDEWLLPIRPASKSSEADKKYPTTPRSAAPKKQPKFVQIKPKVSRRGRGQPFQESNMDYVDGENQISDGHDVIGPMQAIYIGGDSTGCFRAEWRQQLLEETMKIFPSFTVSEATGVFKGKCEQTVVIQIATNDLDAVKSLASLLRRKFQQQGVGVLLQNSTGPAIYGRIVGQK